MSSSVGRNSLIMASGTAASRVTGQIRTILLAATIGTTGITANAYQAGSMIPQVVFTLVSGGIFNAVLVPQIVRTLQHKDAQERLNKLITFAITLLLSITLLMAAATPLLTRLYANGGPDMIALTNSFTLWCMPQIFFYGLYTVLGQILAAKGHFGMYAWSSVGANIISSAGFIAFIAMFGKSDRQPIEFWTHDKLLLTAGMWTLGVAFQALILFLPLHRIGLKYRPQWGVAGIGLRSMGPVAAWSLGIVTITQLITIITTRVTTSAPERAGAMMGLDQFSVAGNATYQNAYTISILPYSLIAVSVATAIFPKISQAIADRNIDAARRDLSSSMRNVGLLMCFFTVAFLVMPMPIIVALLPSVTTHAAQLMAGPLMALSFTLPLTSAYLIIQRTFYAFEDGKRPFIFMALQAGLQLLTLFIGINVLPPTQWATMTGVSVSVGYILAFPALAWMLRKRFEGNLDGRRITVAYAKALLASAAALVTGLWLRSPVYAIAGVHLTPDGGEMSWIQAVISALLLTIVITVVYLGVLYALRTDELMSLANSIASRLGLRKGKMASDEIPENTDNSPENADTPKDEPSLISTSPESRMSGASQPSHIPMGHGVEGHMKPELGDIIINRYTLVSLLRKEPGVQVWEANDRVLARDCQLFIVTDGDVTDQVNNIASSLALSRGSRFTPVLQFHDIDGVCVVITQLDAGLSLTDYFAGAAGKTLSFDGMKSVLGETTQSMMRLLSAGLNHTALSTETIRVTSNGVQIADAVISPLMADLSDAPEGIAGEQLAVRQISALLFAMLTKHHSAPDTIFDLADLPNDVPDELRLICARGLNLRDGDQDLLLLTTLAELDALLGDWQPLTSLATRDIALPSADGDASIIHAELRLSDPASILPVPDELTTLPAVVPDAVDGQDMGTVSPDLLISDAAAEEYAVQHNGDKPADGAAKAAEGSAATVASGVAATFAGVLAAVQQGLKAAGSTMGRWWNMGKAKISGTQPSEDVNSPNASTEAESTANGKFGKSSSSVASTGHGEGAQSSLAGNPAFQQGMDFRDVAAAEMAGLLSHADTDTEATLFPTFGEQATGNSNPTMQFDFTKKMPTVSTVGSGAPEMLEATGQIPTVVAGEASQLALEEERQAAQTAGAAALPPSFTPRMHSQNANTEASASTQGDDDIADAKLFGGLSTKVIAIGVVAIVVIAALLLALNSLSGGTKNEGIVSNDSGQWPTMNLDEVPFGDKSASSESSDDASSQPSESASSSESADAQASASSSESASKDSKAVTVTHADKNVSAVPAPKVPENNTPYDIDKQQFLTNPAGQQGLGYYMHLSQPQTAQRFVIKIRSSGGKGYLRVNTSSDPTQGSQVAEFSFDASGTTEVRFTATKAQDFLLWVPMDSLPNNQLYVNSVQIY